jgi:RNA polymerase sigma-70 factor, ECF subfamily
MADIYREIEAEIPRLRRYARALARDVATADDLVQDCLVRALAKLHLWQEGTSLRAWLLTIVHNQHVNNVRRTIRAGTPVELSEVEPQLSRAAEQYGCLELRDLDRALARLPEEQRAPILLVGLEGLGYEAAAALLAIPVGTVRSRLSRGRNALRQLMSYGLDQPAAPESLPLHGLRRSRSVNAAHSPALPAHARQAVSITIDSASPAMTASSATAVSAVRQTREIRHG